jgi:hypothetical protein
MNKFIWTKKNALSSSFCRGVIQKFDRDLRKVSGTTLGGINENVKKSSDIAISRVGGWENEDKIFYKSLTNSIVEYKEYLSDNLYTDLHEMNLTDTGYQIQRTIGGVGFYNWHHDFSRDELYGNRRITFIWYLNTVEGPGGETEFIDGTKIKPEEGKLLFFPATWDFVHRGIMPPKGSVKYLCTGWMHSNSLS